MYEITAAEHKTHLIPSMDFRGTPVGVDIRRANKLDVLPLINTGIDHKDPGILRAPQSCFAETLKAFNKLF